MSGAATLITALAWPRSSDLHYCCAICKTVSYPWQQNWHNPASKCNSKIELSFFLQGLTHLFAVCGAKRRQRLRIEHDSFVSPVSPVPPVLLIPSVLSASSLLPVSPPFYLVSSASFFYFFTCPTSYRFSCFLFHLVFQSPVSPVNDLGK